jgi:hypothetical protein
MNVLFLDEAVRNPVGTYVPTMDGRKTALDGTSGRIKQPMAGRNMAAITWEAETFQILKGFDRSYPKGRMEKNMGYDGHVHTDETLPMPENRLPSSISPFLRRANKPQFCSVY